MTALEHAGYRECHELEIISDDVNDMGYDRALARYRAAFAKLLREAQKEKEDA